MEKKEQQTETDDCIKYDLKKAKQYLQLVINHKQASRGKMETIINPNEVREKKRRSKSPEEIKES